MGSKKSSIVSLIVDKGLMNFLHSELDENSIYFGDDFIFDIEPQFLIQRTLNGKTKSFVKKGDSITGEKVERDTEFADYFGFKSQILSLPVVLQLITIIYP